MTLYHVSTRLKKPHRVNGPRKTFKDTKFKRDGKYIYALASVDARGLTSGYSEQVEVRFNIYDNKILRKRISDPNAPKPYPNLYLRNDFFIDAIPSSDASRMRIYFDPEYYDVVKSNSSTAAGGGTTGQSVMNLLSSKPAVKTDTSLKLIGSKYKLQIINLDLQNSQTFEIDIEDTTGVVEEVPMGQADIKSIL